MKMIETHALTKLYGSSRGITDLELNVEKGDFFGFIGPNGAGKSTTIRTLLGLIAPTSGSAEVAGLDIIRNKPEILSKTGYMPSEAIFYGGMKVREVIRYSARLRRSDCERQAKRLCERLQLDTSKRVDELSFGNRKKVAIVCAMQHCPELYILDEPTSGLDPLMQREFFALLKERHNDGATIFLSSHILSEIQRYCDRAAIIRDGRLIACGDVEALAKTNAKRVTLHGSPDLSALSGIKDLQQSSDSAAFLYSGDVRKLLYTLSQSEISDINISEPDLEEVFMHYYTDGGETL